MIGILPPEWTEKPLSEVAEVIQGQSPPGNTYNTSGVGLPFFQGKAEFGELFPETRKWCTDPRKIAEQGDVLLSIRAPVGPTNLARERCCIGRGLAAIRPRAGISTKYLLHYLRSVESELAKKATGTTFGAIGGAVLRSQLIRVAPPEEQQAIVGALDSYFSRLDEVEAGLERVQRNLKRYRASVLQAAVTGRLVPTEAELARAEGREYEPASELLKRILVERRRRWEEAGKRGKYQEPTPPDTSNLPELPEGWCWARLAAIAGLLNGDRGKNYPSRAHYVADGVPFITAGALAEGVIDRTRLNFIPEQRFDLLRAGRVLDGDLLYCLRGSLGKSAIVRGLARGAIASSLLIVRLHREVSATYARTVLQSPWGDRLIRESDNGTAQPNLSAESVASFPIPLPPRLEIVRIAAELDRQNSVLTKQEEAAERGRNRCRELRSRILGQAFEGRIGVQISSEHRQWLEKGRPGLHASLDSPVKATPGGHQGGGLDGNG